jgi:hypothetical protein
MKMTSSPAVLRKEPTGSSTSIRRSTNSCAFWALQLSASVSKRLSRLYAMRGSVGQQILGVTTICQRLQMSFTALRNARTAVSVTNLFLYEVYRPSFGFYGYSRSYANFASMSIHEIYLLEI